MTYSDNKYRAMAIKRYTRTLDFSITGIALDIDYCHLIGGGFFYESLLWVDKSPLTQKFEGLR